jgi:hypothetical protein
MNEDFKDDIRDKMYREEGISYLDDDPVVGFRLAHEIWEAITRRTQVYFPPNKDLYIELYASFSGFGQDPEKYRRYGTRPEKQFFADDGEVQTVEGYPRPDIWSAGKSLGSDSPGFDFSQNAVDTTVVSGSASTSLGTRFWFEIQGKDPDSPAANPIRIPAPEELRDDIREYAESYGGEISRVKGVVFEQRFGMGDTSEFGPNHSDFHVEIPSIQSRGEVVDIMNGALDLTERAARVG